MIFAESGVALNNDKKPALALLAIGMVCATAPGWAGSSPETPATESSDPRVVRMKEIREACHVEQAENGTVEAMNEAMVCIQKELRKDSEAVAEQARNKAKAKVDAERKATQKKLLEHMLKPKNAKPPEKPAPAVESSALPQRPTATVENATSPKKPAPAVENAVAPLTIKEQTPLDPIAAKVSLPGIDALSGASTGQAATERSKLSSPSGSNASETTPAAPTQPGTPIRESRYGTKTACGKPPEGATSTSNHPDQVGVTVAMMMPKEASDMFGRRLGKRYVVYQVRVSNMSTMMQYAVHDISVDLLPALSVNRGQSLANGDYGIPQMYLASSRELSMLRGIPEKGEDLDPRNITLHVLQGVGSVAASVTGLTPFQDVMGGAVATFGGPFLQSFMALAPDHTATQQNRLSDSAFASNTLVDKLHAKVFSIFVPQPMVLTQQQQNAFWSDPQRLLSGAPKGPPRLMPWKKTEYLVPVPLDTVNVCVSGALLKEVLATAPPELNPDVNEVTVGSKIGFAPVQDGVVIHYSLNDTDFADKFLTYSTPFVVSTSKGNIPLRAFTTSKELPQSDTIRRVIEVDQVAAPVILPKEADAVDGDVITMTSDTPDAAIYFTTDGSAPDPLKTSQKYPPATPLKVTKDLKVSAIAVKAPLLRNSTVTTFTYQPKSVAPTFSVSPGVVTSGTPVILIPTSGSPIYYTVNGDTPTKDSTRYKDPIIITTKETIKAIAITDGLKPSKVVTADYSVK